MKLLVAILILLLAGCTPPPADNQCPNHYVEDEESKVVVSSEHGPCVATMKEENCLIKCTKCWCWYYPEDEKPTDTGNTGTDAVP
jgi:hypothetical protein